MLDSTIRLQYVPLIAENSFLILHFVRPRIWLSRQAVLPLFPLMRLPVVRTVFKIPQDLPTGT